jgi:hypothetical protein
MYPVSLQRILRLRIDEKRVSYAEIAAGVIYLLAFNTFLRDAGIGRLGFVLLVAVLCLPFVFTKAAGTDGENEGRRLVTHDQPIVCEPKLLSAAVDANANREPARRRVR